MQFKLNPQQRAAVRYMDGPLLVLAGAGSGKTRVITEKIVYLIKSCNISPANIAAVTFTNKAAREMKERVSATIDRSKTRGLHISTFHTLGLKIIRSEVRQLGLKPGFSIFDSNDSQALLKELMQRENLADGNVIQDVQHAISRWKSSLITPEQAVSAASDEPTHREALIYAKYQRYLRAYNAVDFDDLILLPVQLFRAEPHILDKWQNRIRYLLVDEYQDTNTSQYELVKRLCGPRANLTVVGDDDQSIYAWRGARPENMRELQDDYPNLKVIKLEQNYRSAGRVLKAANTLIANNDHVFKKALWSDLGYGDPIRVLETRNEEHEAQQVISELISHRFKHRTRYSDYAILYRGNHQSRLFEKMLREQNVPYFLSGGNSFFAYSEVRDIMSYLRLLVNNDDDAAFLRVVNTPRREIGASTVEKLGTYANSREISLFAACFELGLQAQLAPRAVTKLQQFAEWLTHCSDRCNREDPVTVIRDVVRTIDYETWLRDISANEKAAERRIANVNELLDWMKRLTERDVEEKSLADLVNHMTLMDILQRNDENEATDQVCLMTLHAAKGLEFPHVFIVGMEEDLLPHRTSIEEDGIEEERRLAYVGITRAQKSLTFSYAVRRKRAGELSPCEPSRFLAELPEDDLEWQGKSHVADPEQRQEKGQAHLANLRGLLGTAEPVT